MSPVTHGMIGWLISQPLTDRRDRILVTVAAVIPDADGVGLLWGFDVHSRIHHIFGHNFLAALLVTLACVSLSNSKARTGTLVLLSFHAHIVGDLLGSGIAWPVFYFWPLSDVAISLFQPLQWELVSLQNTMVTFSCLLMVGWCGVNNERTFIELFSATLDAKIVQTLQKRFRSIRHSG